MNKLIAARISLALGLVLSAGALAYTAHAFAQVQAATMLYFREDTLMDLRVQGSILLVVFIVMLVGAVLQMFNNFKAAWIVLLIVPILGIIEFVGLGGIFVGIFGCFGGLAAHFLRLHAIEIRMNAVYAEEMGSDALRG